jgi:hypothetical protein
VDQDPELVDQSGAGEVLVRRTPEQDRADAGQRRLQ